MAAPGRATGRSEPAVCAIVPRIAARRQRDQVTAIDTHPTGARRGARHTLDALSFLLADVRDGLGVYLAIWLLTTQRWDEARIGIVMTISGAAALLAQAPLGALIDRCAAKRAVVVAAVATISAATVAIVCWPTFPAVAAAKAALGIGAAALPPALAALTLGIFGAAAYSRHVGRNEAFNHAGNAGAAILLGILAELVSPGMLFLAVPVLGAASIATVLALRPGVVDHAVARGLSHGPAAGTDPPAPLRTLFASRGLVAFTAAVTLFHLANAAMLPLLGQTMALRNPGAGTPLLSLAILTAQAVMVPIALLVGARTDRWGRKPFYLVAFAVLAVRGALCATLDGGAALIATQILDGIGAGITGSLFPIVVADMTRGTGHYNLALGAVGTVQGIGAAASTTLAGLIVVSGGYPAAFMTLAGIAGLGLALLALAVPETMPRTHAGAP